MGCEYWNRNQRREFLILEFVQYLGNGLAELIMNWQTVARDIKCLEIISKNDILFFARRRLEIDKSSNNFYNFNTLILKSYTSSYFVAILTKIRFKTKTVGRFYYQLLIEKKLKGPSGEILETLY